MNVHIVKVFILLILVHVVVFSQRQHEMKYSIQKERVGKENTSDNRTSIIANPQRGADSISDNTGKNEPPNSIFFELFGQGIFFTLNYERYIDNHIALRIGYGMWFSLGRSIPFMVNYYSGNRHKFELGLGLVYHAQWADESLFNENKPIALSSTIGYKFQPAADSLMLRIGLTPYYSFQSKKAYLFFGLSVGICFY